MKFRTQRFVTLLATLLVVALATAAPAALTDKFVTAAGAGAADGSSVANAESIATMITTINGGGAAGTRFRVLASGGTIARTTTADSITGSGSATSPIIIVGESAGTTLGDGRQGRTNGNGALITTNMPSWTYTTGNLSITGSWVIVQSINFSGAPSAPLVTAGADGAVVSCPINNSSTNAAATALTTTTRTTVLDNDLTLSGGSGGLAALNAVSSPRVIGNRIKGGTAFGIQVPTAGVPLILGNVIFRSTVGVQTNGGTGIAPFIANNTIVNNSSDGINIITGSTALQLMFGNLITDNGGFGINGVSAANAIPAAYNRLDRNTSGATNLATDWLAATSYGHNTTSILQAAEYVNAAGDDYRLMSTSSGLGAGLFQYMDIGALQKQLTSGSTSTDGGTTGNKFYTGD